MRTWIVAVMLLGLLLISGSLAAAGPAPDLTKVRITHVGADETGWIPASQASVTTLYGQSFYIAVEFTGYPKDSQIFLYQNGSQIPLSEIKEPFGRKGIGNPLRGWVYQFAVPIRYGNGTIAVEAAGTKGGRYTSTLYGVRAEYQPEPAAK